jgi:hypothetical protein
LSKDDFLRDAQDEQEGVCERSTFSIIYAKRLYQGSIE